MSFNSEYQELRKKRQKKSKQELEESSDIAPLNFSMSNIVPVYEYNAKKEDIAPVANTETKTKEKNGIFDGYFQKGAFEDGYQLGDIVKTLISTDADVATSLPSKVLDWGENILDAGATGIANIADKFGKEETRDKLIEFTKKDLYDGKDVARKILESKLAAINPVTGALSAIVKLDNMLNSKETVDDNGEKVKVLEDNSILDDKADAFIGSAGEVVAKMGISAFTGPLGADIVTGVTTFGGQAENALKEGANIDQATGSALISAGAEIIFEKFSGGIKFGGKAVTDNLSRFLSEKVSNVALRTVLNGVADIGGESLEEVFTEFVSKLGTKLYKEENLGEILFSDEALQDYADAALAGGLLGGAFSGGKAVKATIDGVDYKTGLTDSENKVVNKEVENRIAEREANGEKVTTKVKNEIYDEVMEDLKKGYISTDTIESVLDEKGYDNYKNLRDTESRLNEKVDSLTKEIDTLLDKENPTIRDNERLAEARKELETAKSDLEKIGGYINEHVTYTRHNMSEALKGERKGKGSYLAESYNEIGRLNERYVADFSKYKGTKHEDAARKTIENAMKRGANNTNRVHDIVEMGAKLSADTGVVFDWAGNEDIKKDFIKQQKAEIEKLKKLTELSEEDAAKLSEFKEMLQKVESGEITVNGNITDNGVVINLDSKKALNRIVGHEITHSLEKSAAYKELKEALFSYAKDKGVDVDAEIEAKTKTYKGVKKAQPEAELVADLVGDYIFNDYDFVFNLATNNRNVFQKVYDEVKYLYKLATAGSKEARDLERAKRNFERAYRESANATAKTEGVTKNSLSDKKYLDKYSQKQYNDFGWARDAEAISKNELDDLYSKLQGKGSLKKFTQSTHGEAIIEVNDKPHTTLGANNVFAFVTGTKNNPEITRIVRVNLYDEDSIDTFRKDIYERNDRRTLEAYARVMGEEFIRYYDRSNSATYGEYKDKARTLTSGIEGEGNTPDDRNGAQRSGAFEQTQLNEIAPINETSSSDDVFFDGKKAQYSLSDSDGKQLSKGQQEYFKNSKIRDENGNLKVMYHGSPETFSVFDKSKAKSSGTYGKGFYFTDSTSHASTYGKTYDVYLNITNPLQDGTNDITKEQIRKFVEAIAENEDYGIDNYGYDATIDSVTNSVYGKSDFAMILDLNISCVGNMVEAIELFNKVNGTDYNGIVAPLETVAFYPEQIKSVANAEPTADPDIRYSLSEEGEQLAPVGRRGTYGKDFRVQGDNVLAPVTEAVPVATTTAKAPVSENVAPEGFAPIPESEANAMQSENIATLNDSDAPSEIAPYYGEDNTESATPSNPFEQRDYTKVGNPKEQAYTAENPEAKPFFQEAAQGMLGDLQNTLKGERWYNDALFYESGGEQGFSGTRRDTTADIADLLDGQYHYTYQQIEEALNAIINDEKLNACAKRIEFALNDRLLNGYTDINGMEIPPNQDYINLLSQMRMAEDIHREGVESIEHITEAPYEPMEAQPTEDIAPLPEAYEAIRPKQSNEQSEPRMKRVSTESNAKQGEKERKWVNTSTSSEAVDGIITPDDIPDDARYYQVKSNKKTLETANTRLARDGYAKSREYFEGRMSERKLTVEDIALGERLIQEAAKAGDAKAVRDLIIDVSILGTELGQRVQALSMIRRLTPEGQLKTLQRTIERGKTKGDKAFDGVEVTDEMTKRILSVYNEDGTFDQDKLNKAVEDVKQDVADQMSVSVMDRINSWRYLSMLGNPKTHIRNMVSNVAMLGTRTVKNAIARTIEDIAPVKSRTKTWKRASEAVKNFAKQTTKLMEADISDDAKYSEEGSVKAKRKVFKTKAVNAASNFNSAALEWEDAVFSKPAFRHAFQEFLTANGIVTEEDIKNNSKIVEKAKDYALDEAKKATFRQDSYFANKIKEVENKNPAFGVAIGAVMPFKKTPINIAKTGVAYSPLGFARNVYDAVKVAKGEMEASEAIDHLAQTLTGTSLALIGYFLASAGVLNGAGEDDKEGKYDYQLGEQSYSFTFGGDTYSLNWLSPVAMPLFVGANAYEKLVEKEEWDMNVVADAMAQTLDPLSEMSFLSSLDDVLSSYDSGMGKIMGAAESMAQSYITQFIPTLSSQVAQVMDDTKRSTKASGNSGYEFGEETLKKIMYKIPGLRNKLEPTTDIWGNDYEQTENVVGRAFESFFSPASKREDITTFVDEELKTLYGETGATEVLPSIPDDYFSYEGKKYDMSAKEYTEFKKTYGQTAYELLSDLFMTDTYEYSSYEDRADMVKKVFDYARDEAKQGFFATREEVEYSKDAAIKGAILNDMSLDEYSFFEKYPEKYSVAKSVGGYESYKSYTSTLWDIKADKDENGKSITGSRKEKVIAWINEQDDLDYGEKLILFKSEYNADDTYNYEIIDYLNGREDISYQEMETILKELGFNVDSKGNITWD